VGEVLDRGAVHLADDGEEADVVALADAVGELGRRSSPAPRREGAVVGEPASAIGSLAITRRTTATRVVGVDRREDAAARR
jgi:hypothetical protein